MDQQWSDDLGEDYCRECVREHGQRCKQCPAPPLLPEAQPGVAAYLVCATQWRVSGMGSRTGLDYGSCRVALDAHASGADPSPWAPEQETWRQLQIIEHAMLECDGERRKRDAATRRP